MQGKIPEFVRNDVEVAYLIDGEKASSFPEKSSKYNVTIECTGATGEWDKDKWGLMLTNATAEKIKCSIAFETKNTRNVTIHGAVQETITLSDGQTIETDATGIGTAEVAIGETYTLTGSISEYTSEEQIVEDTTTDLYAMPDNVIYWYGIENYKLTIITDASKYNPSYSKNKNNIFVKGTGNGSGDWCSNAVQTVESILIPQSNSTLVVIGTSSGSIQTATSLWRTSCPYAVQESGTTNVREGGTQFNGTEKQKLTVDLSSIKGRSDYKIGISCGSLYYAEFMIYAMYFE